MLSYNFIDRFLIFKNDESEAPGLHRLMVVDDIGVHNLTKLGKVLLKLGVANIHGDAADEDLPFFFAA